jgi:putative ABC transport system substrate-binding protein
MKYIITSLLILCTICGCKKENALNKKIIAITQIVDHPSLNQAKLGIIETLGDEYKIISQDAQGDTIIAQQITKKLISQKPDAIIAISTPSAQILKQIKNSDHIPLFFCSVTYPKEAGLVESFEYPKDMTGVYDAPEIEHILALIQKSIKNIKTIGVIYNASETNSVQTVKELETKAKNIAKIKAISISNSSEISSAVAALSGKVEAIYIPSDNTVWPALETLAKEALKHNIPIISSDPDSAKKGVALALGYSQYDLGVTIANQLKQIFDHHKDLSMIDVQKPQKIKLYINKQSITKLGMILSPSDMYETKVIS